MNQKQKIFIIACLVVIILIIGSSVYISYLQEKEKEGKISVVATFYPLAYFSEEIGGEHVSVTTLVPYNTELHSWEPSASQILATDEADIIFYNGAGADNWFENDIIPAISTGDKMIVKTTEGIELLETGDHDEDNEHGEEDHEDEHEHGDFDPHTWVSPYTGLLQAESVYDALVEKDPENEDYYSERWNGLKSRLQELEEEYSSTLANKTRDSIIVNHAAFGYIADRYGFEQHGVIGLSADEQPSTSDIANLVDEMIEHDIDVVYVDPIYSDKFAQTLQNEVEKQKGGSVSVLKLYFMLGPMDGKDYLEQLESNLENLKIGLKVP